MKTLKSVIVFLVLITLTGCYIRSIISYIDNKNYTIQGDTECTVYINDIETDITTAKKIRNNDIIKIVNETNEELPKPLIKNHHNGKNNIIYVNKKSIEIISDTNLIISPNQYKIIQFYDYQDIQLKDIIEYWEEHTIDLKPQIIALKENLIFIGQSAVENSNQRIEEYNKTYEGENRNLFTDIRDALAFIYFVIIGIIDYLLHLVRVIIGAFNILFSGISNVVSVLVNIVDFILLLIG